MAKQDRSNPAEGQELATTYMSLLEAMQQAMATQKMIESMEVRRNAIRGQLLVTTDPDVQQALVDEERSLLHTMRVTGDRVGRAMEFFKRTTITVHGRKYSIVEASKVMQLLKAQAEQFMAFEQQVDIYHGDSADLKDLADAYRALSKEMARRWAADWNAFMAVLETIRVSSRDVHDFEIGTFQGQIVIEARWNLAVRKWEVDEHLIQEDSRIEKILDRLNTSMMARHAEDGTILRIQITLNAKGDAHFGCDLKAVTQPNFHPFRDVIYHGGTDQNNWTTT